MNELIKLYGNLAVWCVQYSHGEYEWGYQAKLTYQEAEEYCTKLNESEYLTSAEILLQVEEIPSEIL